MFEPEMSRDDFLREVMIQLIKRELQFNDKDSVPAIVLWLKHAQTHSKPVDKQDILPHLIDAYAHALAEIDDIERKNADVLEFDEIVSSSFTEEEVKELNLKAGGETNWN